MVVVCEKQANNATAKQYGKKRKQVFVRPFWDDEAGLLPTSTNDDSEKDFEAMLSEMQSLKDNPPEPSSPAKAAKKRRT
ncbi:hypothetical protein EC988_009678 [Linderina pennispora]|nr:hypothetical protein EC988_009678 [Linderina pennispora]